MILNLTQHAASVEQIAAGVVDVQDRAALAALLTFDRLPTVDEVAARAEALVSIVKSTIVGEYVDDECAFHVDGTAINVMIGGAPFLMPVLDAALTRENRIPLYAFSVRNSIEETQTDGSVRKINVFKHAGFVRSQY